ncbi:UAA transporter family protein [Nitzschia inconspicua]|uniref:UAA transporter family protein n=1 Tax=Nitzschia inconspicua TaxID=303405 RepID=A0A9K3KW38_9STRA|nr:UAA transporter family protein [Nitzschia inconspicua]
MTSDAEIKVQAAAVASSSSSTSSKSSALRFVTCALGICISYWFYGFLQEKLITKSRLGATFMLVVQTLVNILVALVWQQVELRSTPHDQLPPRKSLNHPLIFLTSSCYVLAMAASNESLRFVSYPVAVLGKSCKMIPTMVMGLLIERRNYSLQQWSAALCISCGIALFHLSRIQETSNNDSHSSLSTVNNNEKYWKGMMLLFLSLCMDGFLGACQGILKRPDVKDQQRPPTAVETMLYINLYSLVLLIPMAVISGQWDDGLRLLVRNDHLRWNVAILNAVVAVGQIFIFLTITWYSSLVTTTITTTRKFFTILFSVLHFGHAFSVGQWTSVVMVFSGLYLSIATAGQKNSSNRQPSLEKKQN